ncbi:MYG1 exonuclease isoform X2 [Ambystoma mexicanum]|uniref:MYG1 exonuclease isoform X2 n=1 Tax=Ambystoma mexicanum TaxID=8296 RepID=UPI0037E8F81F
MLPRCLLRLTLSFNHVLVCVSATGPFSSVLHPKSRMTTEPKRRRQEENAVMPVRIGTHNGSFHCDEALACYLLRRLPQYQDAEIIRTRDPKLLSTCDVVVDVGGVYDPETHRYDHHQRSFAENMNSLRPEKPWVTKLSSAGLVYLHFGTKILAHILGIKEDDPMIPVLYDKMYENFVEEIDAIDNGISQCDEEPRYAISTTVSARVGHLNPRWNDKEQDTEAGFRKAMELVGTEFQDRLQFYRDSWLPARALVEEAIRERFQALAPGEVAWCTGRGALSAQWDTRLRLRACQWVHWWQSDQGGSSGYGAENVGVPTCLQWPMI